MRVNTREIEPLRQQRAIFTLAARPSSKQIRLMAGCGPPFSCSNFARTFRPTHMRTRTQTLTHVVKARKSGDCKFNTRCWLLRGSRHRRHRRHHLQRKKSLQHNGTFLSTGSDLRVSGVPNPRTKCEIKWNCGICTSRSKSCCGCCYMLLAARHLSEYLDSVYLQPREHIRKMGLRWFQ